MWKPFLLPMQIGKRTAAFCLMLLATVVATTHDVVADTETINLHDAVTKTLTHNPELQAFDYQLKAQEGRVLQAGRAPTPELSLQLEDALGAGDRTGLDSAQATVSIGWVLERGIRQRYVDAARAGSSLFSVEADIRRLDAAAETARRYLISLAYQARMVNADKTVQLAEETIEAVRKRVKAGKTPEAELSRAQAELARRKLERENIEHELLSANRRLAAQWGETTLNFSRVDGNILNQPHVAPLETLKARVEQNPEFARLLSDQRLKNAELDLALAQEKPGWRLNAGIRRFQITDDQAFVAGITIPFGQRTRNPGLIAEARANLERIDIEQTATRVRIETALYVLYQKLQHSLHVIEAVRNEILPPLEQALTETRRAYNLGRYSYLELRSVQAELLDGHEALIEASIDAHQNIIEIERLTGVRIAQPTQEQ